MGLKGTKGDPLYINEATKEHFTLGIGLDNILANAETGGKQKLWNLARKAANGKDFEIDSADLGIIKQAVENTKLYNNVINGQILEILSEIKD